MVDELEACKWERRGKAKIIYPEYEKRLLAITKFFEKLRLAVINTATVGRDGVVASMSY
ncbi:MAG: hypothetical protein LBU32_32275 [Clostridiales bacterium]|jgi:hypothetical protein|nr:hypothetical protein [Clostridiales bacterium]